MVSRNYALCQGACGKVLRYERHSSYGLTHCGLEVRRLTDAEARSLVEGRPYQRQRLAGAVASNGDLAMRKRSRDRFIQKWTNPPEKPGKKRKK